MLQQAFRAISPRHASHTGPASTSAVLRPKRSELFTHVRTTFHQLNLPAPAAAFHHPRNRVGVAESIPDPVVRASVEADLTLAAHLDEVIRSLEGTISDQAKVEGPDTLELLQTIPGVGRILSLTLLVCMLCPSPEPADNWRRRTRNRTRISLNRTVRGHK